MSDQTDTPRPKVARLINKYALQGIGEELERRWTRTDDRSSLRDLADYFNRQLLEAELDSRNADPLDGGIDNVYRLLTDENVTSGVREETRSRLQYQGVDVDTVESDFVSYQAIRTYLMDVRNASSPEQSDSPDARRKRKRNTIQQLVGRLTTVTEDALSELKSAGHLTLGEFDVFVSLQVHCADCNTQSPVSELLRQGGCQCEESES